MDLKILQVHFSVYMPFVEKNCFFSGNKNLLDYCYENKINTFTSASLYEGKIKQFLNF